MSNAKKDKENKVFVTEEPAASLQAPKGTTSISIAGEEYEVAKDGTVDVPASITGLLIECHGFKPVA